MRIVQLDRRKAPSQSSSSGATLRPMTSTLSSEEVPVIDIYTTVTTPDGDEEKKNRSHQSTVSTIWRSVLSLNPFTRGIANLPRYDVHTSLPPNEEGEPKVPLIALTPPPRQESLDSSSEDSLSFGDSEDLEGDNRPLQSQPSAEEVWLYEQGSNKPPRHAWILRRKPTFKEVDVEAYMANREMSALQEKWNALTMIPHPLVCLAFLWCGLWIPNAMVQEMQDEVQTSATAWPDTWIGEPNECLSTMTTTRWGLPYWPPATVIAVAIGVTLHTPWSMLYHWKYAHQLPPGAPRTNHWSRRMDQAMMHFGCALMAYATSGSWDYFIATALFNADSAYRHFKPKVSPRRNKVRITLAIMAYSIPILRQGQTLLFAEFWAGMGVVMWLFAAYPIGGWSHAVFHIVGISTLIPVLQAASLNGAAQEAVQMAAQCTVWNQQQHAL